jgi:ABC-type proline/glycine betaine transport system substrate-binding protein
MKPIKYFFLLALCFSLAQTKAQVKAKFKKIEYAYYTVKDGKVALDLYFLIDENGFVQTQNQLSNEEQYTTIQLSDKQIETLNTIFNGEKRLKSYMVDAKMKKGEHYAGLYNYLAYTPATGKKDKLCFIDSFMSKSFKEFFDKLGDMLNQQAKTKADKPKYKIGKAKKEILAEHKKSPYLPAIEMSPKTK